VDKQLGLKVEEGKAPAPVISVDSANETPTPNAPNISTLVPPPPTEFEVASIRPSPPDSEPRPGGLRPGGRYEQPNVPLFQLINLAYGISPAAVRDGRVTGLPKWLTPESPQFDLVAKVSRVTGGTQFNQQVDNDDLALMLRNLLADRFKMKVHSENHPLEAYTLSADKPKLKPADPKSRSKCVAERLVFGNPGDGPPPQKISCTNLTLTQFAQQMQNFAPIYIGYPVENATGIQGSYDFTLTFSPIPPGQGGGGGRGGKKGGPGAAPPPQTPDGASEPSGNVSLTEAVQKQLGLKLELRKRPEPVLVIDHIEEKPTEN
jgi:uncharacterized protein (TIGR03435 family)